MGRSKRFSPLSSYTEMRSARTIGDWVPSHEPMWRGLWLLTQRNKYVSYLTSQEKFVRLYFSTYNQTTMSRELLEKYVQAVLSAPQSLQLTAAKEPREFWQRHVLDALKLIELFPPSYHERAIRVLDVGSGNGIP